MKNIFSPVYRQDYLQGFSNGLNPYLKIEENQSDAYVFGFNQGRLDYERMNGKIIHGIPKLIVTNKVLEDFLLAGMLGISINDDDYTAFQIDVISKWYQSGIEKYNPYQSSYLLAILEENGIDII
ncbi:hypothetical protein [Flavobacterium sangjuense]|uniref:Uncharacterized protein n=1 Tax=Flavobacterium sangjuense TaxID=2518177 RepID=A0A4P7PUJ3_9FLAO|nr:hypothetical protein [Flavobacterium sangjuense]QBZ98641.1 hypothetical protein GS03_02150 [Flavobacterium sangjuense]